jgi:putative Mn2+ efflux pump MntP
MIDLLSKYSITEIIIFVIIIAIGIKELIEFIDWAKERTKRYFNKETNSEEAI